LRPAPPPLHQLYAKIRILYRPGLIAHRCITFCQSKIRQPVFWGFIIVDFEGVESRLIFFHPHELSAIGIEIVNGSFGKSNFHQRVRFMLTTGFLQQTRIDA